MTKKYNSAMENISTENMIESSDGEGDPSEKNTKKFNQRIQGDENPDAFSVR